MKNQVKLDHELEQTPFKEKSMSSPNVHSFNDQNFETEVLNADVQVLVIFTATWDGTCRAIQPIIDGIADDFKGRVKVGNMDIDESPETTRKYGVRYVPTEVVFRGGIKVASEFGVQSRERILELLGLA